jgi:hypothetical protein
VPVGDPLILSREYVVTVLTHVGMSAERIEEVLGPISFPAPINELHDRLGKFGITHDVLTDRLGGSP